MNGVLVIDKPAGITSYACVARVKEVLGVKKAGHTGTLDPMATGVLPICLGEATKIVPYLLEGDKCYRATMVLGVETDTLDMEGTVLVRKSWAVEEAAIYEVMSRFVGQIEQKPPYFSSVKHRGRALHRWARSGVWIDVPPRTVEIYRLDVESIDLPYVRFFLSCSKGTYVRVLCADIGKALGCGGTLKELRRLKAGPFEEKVAVSLKETEQFREKVISLNDALAHLPAIRVEKDWEDKLRRGYQPREEIFRGCDISSLGKGDVVKFCNLSGNLIALARWEGNGRARISRVFHFG
ncbi:MAG: tRNA pseudouridine(55) synthase TruB [Syntrophales bacterium]|nr:tRNA pseudouridine(55) synthase TruB [Syntrophales bacterium]